MPSISRYQRTKPPGKDLDRVSAKVIYPSIPQAIFLAWEILQRSLAGYSPWGCEESDMTERLTVPLSLSMTATKEDEKTGDQNQIR